MLRVDGDALLQPIERVVVVAARRGNTREVVVRDAGQRVLERERAGSTGTTVPASFNSVCGALTVEGSPMSPTGVTAGTSGGRVCRHASTAPSARPAAPMVIPPMAIERFEGPCTIAAAMSCVESPESEASPC